MSIINFSQNSISGRIPQLKKCRKLVSLSLASNNLTGSIPEELQNLKLALFNVPYNQLSRRVPFLLMTGLPASYLQANPGLFGPGLPNSCQGDEKMHQNSVHTKLG